MDEILDINQAEEKQIGRSIYCSFLRGERTYYIPVESLREVIEIVDLFPVPLAPRYIKGAVILKGFVIPAIDLAILNDTRQDPNETRTLIIVDALREFIGFLSEGLPSFISSDESIPQESIIDINRFFETYMIKEPS